MVLPVPEFAQAGDNNREIVRIGSVQCIKEFTNRAASLGGLVEFDAEFHRLNINIGVARLVKLSAWRRLPGKPSYSLPATARALLKLR